MFDYTRQTSFSSSSNLTRGGHVAPLYRRSLTWLKLAPVTFTLQEGYVLSNKAQAVYTVSRAFDVPVHIRANIRSLHETLGELTDALEDLDLRNR
ncbi:hypothetical protein [Vibrio phage J14]|nr:hypothetical protein [Vibrio phage J14]